MDGPDVRSRGGVPEAVDTLAHPGGIPRSALHDPGAAEHPAELPGRHEAGVGLRLVHQVLHGVAGLCPRETVGVLRRLDRPEGSGDPRREAGQLRRPSPSSRKSTLRGQQRQEEEPGRRVGRVAYAAVAQATAVVRPVVDKSTCIHVALVPAQPAPGSNRVTDVTRDRGRTQKTEGGEVGEVGWTVPSGGWLVMAPSGH